MPLAALPPAAARRRSPLRSFVRAGLYTAVACLVIALLLSAQRPARLPVNLVYSFAIGSLCFLTIDGGRLLLARWLVRQGRGGAAALEGWPGWGWMSLIIVLGVPLAYAAGTLIGQKLTGIPSAPPGEGAWNTYAFLLLMSITVAAVGTLFFHARARLAAAQTEAQTARRIAAETQLRLLQSQLEPHMLFNTLANLRVLIGMDPDRAQAMLDRLIAFLRATLGASRVDRHALCAEFARSADYLALIGVRMGPRLRVRLDLPEALAALPVPPLLLQPLVENAVKHGLEPKLEGGSIEVRARREGEQLLLEVQDDGLGPAAAGAQGEDGGFGTLQVRERLATLYGERAAFELLAPPAGGTLARIVLPIEP